ncbi:hypothetical protein P872_09660 [Rhodonellum psychrophilum GCM71 = DSM 17998]|uniref:Uncharacterized protein n=1 Tax=Rhodonellum psychrophilum GCM71 = DSM 17998 TaxID=1123057 RepID=U5BZR7_9BACT|nr:hypothetical protein P872_09660 [Rhodonellum psychrophilum GCM71 = DSM 17998]
MISPFFCDKNFPNPEMEIPFWEIPKIYRNII